MKVLVCGSRDWRDYRKVESRLKALAEKHKGKVLVIQGEQRGADLLARQAALKIGLDVIGIPANWKGRGKSAGPYRNRLMLDLLQMGDQEKLVLAFHEDLNGKSVGTRDCVTEARKRELPVEVVS